MRPREVENEKVLTDIVQRCGGTSVGMSLFDEPSFYSFLLASWLNTGPSMLVIDQLPHRSALCRCHGARKIPRP